MDQNAVSDKSLSSSHDHPTSSDTESKPSDVSLAPSTEHLESPSFGSHDHPTSSDTESKSPDVSLAPSTEHLASPSSTEEPTSDHELLPATDCTSTSQSNDETPALALLTQSQQSSQLNSESENLSSSSPDISKSKFDLPAIAGSGLLPLPPQHLISKRPPLLPFPPMRVPMRLQSLRPSIINNQIRQSQKPGLLPTPPRPSFPSPFIRNQLLDMQRNPSAETFKSDSKFVSIEKNLMKKPETPQTPEILDSTPTVSSLPPFFRNTLMKDSSEPPSKKGKKYNKPDPPNLVTQNFINPNHGYYPYNNPYQNNGYYPHMYQPGFLPPPGYFNQMQPSNQPTFFTPPPLPPSIPQPPLPLDPPKPPPPPPPPIYPTPPSPQPIQTNSPPPSPPLLHQLNPHPTPEMPIPHFQSSPLNPLESSSPNTASFSFSGLITPPPPPPQLTIDNNIISSLPCTEYLRPSETSPPRLPLYNIPLPQ